MFRIQFLQRDISKVLFQDAHIRMRGCLGALFCSDTVIVLEPCIKPFSGCFLIGLDIFPVPDFFQNVMQLLFTFFLGCAVNGSLFPGERICVSSSSSVLVFCDASFTICPSFHAETPLCLFLMTDFTNQVFHFPFSLPHEHIPDVTFGQAE